MLTQVRKSCDHFFHIIVGFELSLATVNQTPKNVFKKVEFRFSLGKIDRLVAAQVWNYKFRRNINSVISAQPLRNENYSEAQRRKKNKKYFYVWLSMKNKYERIENTPFQMGRRCNLNSNYNFEILRIFLLSSMDWHIIWSNIFLGLRIVVGPVSWRYSVIHSVLQSKRKQIKIFIQKSTWQNLN